MFARHSWNLGRIAGIPLLLHPTFLIWPAALLFMGAEPLTFLVVGLTFGCVVLHELGHALMARRYGIATTDITILPIGGVARLERMPRSAGPELAVALAGPAVNFLLAGGLWLLVNPESGGETLLGELLGQMLAINLALGLFNLLPIFPMDGGRVLRALLSSPMGRLRATEVAVVIGHALIIVAVVWCVFNGHLVQAAAGVFLYTLGSAELRAVRFENGTAQRHAPPLGHRWVTRGDGVWQAEPIVAPIFAQRPHRWL